MKAQTQTTLATIFIAALGVTGAFLLVWDAQADEVPSTWIENNVGYYNDSNAYITVNPYRDVHGQWDWGEPYEHTFTIKNNRNQEGGLCVAYKFNERLEDGDIWLEMDNYTNVTRSRTCAPPLYYNYTTDPKTLFCWENTTLFNNETNETEGWEYSLLWEHEFEWYNLSVYTIFWNKTVNNQYWKDVTGFINYGKKNEKHYYYSTQPLPVQPDETRKWKISYLPNTTDETHKWDITAWGTTEEDCTCILDDTCVFVADYDPEWWNSSWNKCKNVSIEVYGSSENLPVFTNITGLTLNNSYEGRLVNAPCGNDGTAQTHTVRASSTDNAGSDWADIVFLYDENDGNSTWSYYYDYDQATDPGYTLILFDPNMTTLSISATSDTSYDWHSDDTAKYSAHGYLNASEIDSSAYGSDQLQTQANFSSYGNITVYNLHYDTGSQNNLNFNRYLSATTTHGTWSNYYNLLTTNDNPDEYRLVVDYPTEDTDSGIDIAPQTNITTKVHYDQTNKNADMWIRTASNDSQIWSRNTTAIADELSYWGLFTDEGQSDVWHYKFFLFDGFVNPRESKLPTISLGSEETSGDSTAPTYSNIIEPTDPSIYSYGTSYQFNATWTDETALDDVWIEENMTGALGNTTVTTNNSDEYYYDIASLGAEIYSVRWCANDTMGNENCTSSDSFTVDTAPIQLSLSTNGTWTYPTQTNTTGSESNSGDTDITYELWRNGTKKDDTSPYWDNTTLAAGYYVYRFNATGGTNYTANSTGLTIEVTIDKAPTSCNLLLNGTDGNVDYFKSDVANFTATVNETGLTVGIATNITGWSDPTGTTPLENTSAMNEIGYFNITGYYMETANYTGCLETHYANVTNASTPDVTGIEWKTTGGFTDDTLTLNQILDFINATIIDTSTTSVTLDVYKPDGSKAVDSASMTNTSTEYTYATDITLSSAGNWTINISATNGYYTGTNSSTINVSTQTQSIKDGWYGYTEEKIFTSGEISTLSSYGYDIFELETNASTIDSDWSSLLDAINDSKESNIRIGLNFRLDWNYTNYTVETEFLDSVAANFSDLTSSPYSTAMEYISLEIVDGGSYTDAQKYGTLNNVSKNITAHIDNDYVIFSRNYNNSNLDSSYIQYTNLIYLKSSSEAEFINLQMDYFGNTTSLNRIYISQTDAMKTVIQTFHENVVDNLRSTPVMTSLGEERATALSNNDVVVFNNQSSQQTYIINVSELAAESGKDAWDYTNGYVAEENTDLNFSVTVDAYNGTIVIFEDLDHIQLDSSLENSDVYKGASSSSSGFDYINISAGQDGSWGLAGAYDIQTELFDPHYKRANFITYYGWLNSSFIKSPEGWEDYTVVIFSDQNNGEIDSLNFMATDFYGYISVADYNNSEAWQSAKETEVDDWLALNGSLHIFIDGLDTGIGGDNFTTRMKELVDYVQVVKDRNVILNTYTAYEDFATWGDGGVMKESCVNRWNGALAAAPDNYTRENWTLELEKSEWYQNHNVDVFCQAFDNRSDDGTYQIKNYTELQNIYFASKVLGYDYFYLSQPDFNYAHKEYVYDVGTDLDRTYHQLSSDPNTYYRTYEKGIVYYNSTSEEGWIEDGRVINNAQVCFYLYDDSGFDEPDWEFTVNNRQPTGSSEDYSIADDIATGTWAWRCADITTPPTNGRYLIEAWVNGHTTTAGQGFSLGWQQYNSQDRGRHSWYDTSVTDSYTIYGDDKNWMVNVTVNETKKTSVDTTTDITQSELVDGSNTYMNLSSTHSVPIEVWSYPTTVSDFDKIFVKNSTGGWAELNYVNDSSCDNGNPTWNTTTVEAATYKACIKPSGSDTLVRVSSPSLSTREYLLGDTNDPPDSITTPNNPTDGATGQSTTVTLNVTPTDPDGDVMNVSFYNASDDSLLGTNISISNNTEATYSWSGLSPGATYSWYVNVTDGTEATQSSTWNFTTNYEPTVDSVTEPTDPATYSSGANYTFLVNVTDMDLVADIDTVLFEWNGTNYTATNNITIDTDTLEFNYTLNDLAAQTETVWNWYANDSLDQWFSSGGNFTVSKASTSLDVAASDQEIPNDDTRISNITANYSSGGTAVTENCTLAMSGPTVRTEDMASGAIQYYTFTPDGWAGGNYTMNVTCTNGNYTTNTSTTWVFVRDVSGGGGGGDGFVPDTYEEPDEEFPFYLEYGDQTVMKGDEKAFVFKVAPGTTFAGELTIVNALNETREAVVYSQYLDDPSNDWYRFRDISRMMDIGNYDVEDSVDVYFEIHPPINTDCGQYESLLTVTDTENNETMEIVTYTNVTTEEEAQTGEISKVIDTSWLNDVVFELRKPIFSKSKIYMQDLVYLTAGIVVLLLLIILGKMAMKRWK